MSMLRCACLIGLGMLATGLVPIVRAGESSTIRVHEIESPYQKGKTEILVLTPDKMKPGKRYRVVYILPVERGRGGKQWGNGLEEIRKLDLHNKLDVIFVMPTFSDWPWYCDHATNPAIRQESHFLKVVLPFVEKHYPVIADSSGRLLVGFSKSGWGAFSLLLRHPEMFGRAAAWDAPLNMAAPNRFGMQPIFDTSANFKHYQISKLLDKQAERLRDGPRLGLMGYANFQSHHQAIHEQMQKLRIPHRHDDVRKMSHTWRSGWLEAAVRFVVDPGQ